MTYPDSSVVTYGYSNRNQMLRVTPSGSSALATYTYDAAGNTLTKTLGNGTVATSAYDADNRLTNLVHTVGSTTLASFQYGYNSVSDRTYVQHQDGKGDAYSYDAIDQVTGVQYQATNPGTTPTSPMRTVGYGLDSVGNWTGLTDSVNGNTSFTANNLNQYTAVNTTTPTYDGNGNLTGGLGAFVYDAQNRLTSATNGTNTITFSYDPLNRCVSRTDNGTTTFLIYDGWSLIDEQNSAGVAVAKYIGGSMIDEMLTVSNSAGTSYYQQDGLGSMALLTNTTGAAVESYTYDIYGTPTIENGSGTVLTGTAYGNRFLFTGREYLADVQIYDYRNRMYSAQWGRWLSRDPLKDAETEQGANLYEYAADDPVCTLDVLGLAVDGAGRHCDCKDMQEVDEFEDTPVGTSLSDFIPHTFLTTPFGSFGHWPQKKGNMWGPGKVQDDSKHHFNSHLTKKFKSCPATTDLLHKSINAHLNDSYNVFNFNGGSNCTSWADWRLSDAGLESPFWQEIPLTNPWTHGW